ncbi:rhodanese-like domain-containing protein [Pseudochryseolinea flava]|uniref:Rhodanese-like domain-containing protein n=2 Tax=Pseudochryseolinea flava TaxID=2059302 RepID=A0A364XV22_9BACT|nr:rhodanese-like domain-containing protein [Pseudochryseolinea flava]
MLVACVQETTTLAPKDFQKKAAETKDVVILDVRTKEEVDQGVIPGAINVDFKSENFQEQISKLDKNKTYLLYCKGGVRSSKSVDIMKSLGFKKLYDLEGGIDAWREEGLKTTK